MDGERLASVLATPPMMAEWRVVVVREVEALASSPRARELLTGLAVAPPTGLAAVLVASIPRGSSARFWKDLRSRARALELAPLAPEDLPGWLLERASELGVGLEEDAALALAEAVGSQLGVLARELEKLSAFARPDAAITRADVEAAGIRLPAQDRWQWFDLVGSRKFAEALQSLPVLFAQGESAVGLAIQLGRPPAADWGGGRGRPGRARGPAAATQRWLARRVGPQGARVDCGRDRARPRAPDARRPADEGERGGGRGAARGMAARAHRARRGAAGAAA